MAKQHILVIEDEEDILEVVRYNLSRDGFEVATAMNGAEGLAMAMRAAPDLILLDLMLPGMDGLDVCRQLKSNARTAAVPVLMMTARGEEADVVRGLEMGAADYVTKPFSLRVLVARVRAVLRRGTGRVVDAADVIRIHDLVITPGRREVLCKHTTLDLTATEFNLLLFLVRRPGWVFTREQIIDGVKGEDYPSTDRAVDVQVLGLRRKLGKRGLYIETVRGIGYRFKE